MKSKSLSVRVTNLILFVVSIVVSLPAASANSVTRTEPSVVNGTPVSEEQGILEPWSESVFAEAEKEFGPLATQRLRYVYDTARTNQDRSIPEKLAIANATLNKLPWVSDQAQWNVEDYWATPLELIVKAGGDCEDMAIAKYVMLRMMGVPERNLYLGYGKLITRNEAHMVLVWVSDTRTENAVLDNYVQEVLPGNQRTDLQAIYLTDVNGNLILIDDDDGQRKIKSEISAQKLSKLEAVKQHIKETREKYKEYNEGRPLFRTN